MQPPARGRSPKPGRGRGPTRWTPWEIGLIIVSVLMIAFPLYAGTTRLIFAPSAPAQESTPPPAEASPPVDPAQANTSPPAEASPTNDPVFPETETPAPPPSNTPPPAASDTPPPAASNTPGAGASNTPALPTSTSGSTVEQGPTRTSTSTPLVSVTRSPTPGSPTVTNTPPTGTPPTATTAPPTLTGTPPTATTAPPTVTGTPPTATATFAAATGVRVFKVPSVSEATTGQQFSYSISVVTTSTSDSQVTLDDAISDSLELLSVSSGSGSCSTSGQSIRCELTIRDINPATVTVQVRVRATVPIDTVITNEASAGGATSSRVSVRVIGAPAATFTVTGTPPTNTPTNTPVNTTIIVPPSSTPRPDDGGNGNGNGSGSGGGGGGSRDTAVPVAPPAPPTPDPNALPTEPPTPGPGGVVSVRPTAAVRPTRVPAGPTNTPADLIPIAGTTSPTAALGGSSSSQIFFRLASDWGSAYPGQPINFTLAVRNTRAPAAGGANDLRNLTVRSVLPDNLDILGTDADRGSDPTLNGNEVAYSLPLLQPGEGVEILIASRIKPNVTAGTILVAQGQLTFDGQAQGLFSNIVTVQVVGNAQQTAAPLLTATVGIAATSGSGYPAPATATTGAATATTRPGGPTATATRTSPPASAPSVTPFPYTPQQPAPLPETGAGVPFMGILLLGMTLMTRTWRLHRAKDRL